MTKKIFKSNFEMKSLNLNHRILRAALLVLLATLGIGNAWAFGNSSYYASLQIKKAGTSGAGKVYVSKTETKPSSEVTTAVKSDATTSSGGDRKFYYWVDVTSPGYYVTLSDAVSGTYNGNTGEKSVSLKASTSDGETKAYTATATFSEITINNGTASPATIAAEDNSATATTNTCTVTYATKGDNTNDFKTPTIGSATGHGSFTAALGGVTSDGVATVNVTFKGDGTYGGNVASANRSRTSTAVVTLTSAPGNNSGTCTVTASFPNIIIGDGSFAHMTTINTVPKSATATFPVQWADDAEDFSASFGSVTGGGAWTVDGVTYTATDARSGTISIDYTFNPNSVTGDHSAVLTLAANANAGGASKTLTLTAEAEALAEHDASIGDTKYTTLAEAITAANGMNTNPTVKILRNVEGLTSALEIKKPMTIDLNSFTVSGTLTSSVNKLFYLNTATAVLTINDSRNGGKIAATGDNNAILYTVLVDKGSLVLTKGDIEMNNTNTGGTAKANAVRIKAGARFAMAGGNLTATTAGSYAYGLFVTTNPSDANMIAVSGGTITATAAQTLGIGVYCQSSSATPAADPNNANVLLDGVTVNASTTGTTDAYAVQTDAGVILGINSGTYNATAATTTARALLTSGYTAVVNGTFNAVSGASNANAIRVEAGITAVRNGAFFATAQTNAANTVVVASEAKLLTYGGTFHGKLENIAKDKNATGVYVNGTLEAQGGTFIGEAANSGLATAQVSVAAGVYANTGSNVTLSNATLRGLTDNTYVNGAYALYSKTTNPVNLTNCTLEATSTYQYGYGIYNIGSSLTANNCEITVNTTYAYNYGVYNNSATANTEMVHSTITCTSGTTYAYGANVLNGTLTATDCTFSAETKRTGATSAGNCQLFGINVASGKTATLTGCTINTTGSGTYSNNGYGIYVDGSVDVTDCEVTVSNINSGAYAICNTANTTAINVYSGKFKATATSTGIESNATAAAAKQQLYGGYYVHNTNLAKYLPAGYMVETLTAGTEFNAGYKYHIRPETVVNDPVCKIGSVGYATLEEALEFVNKNSGTEYTIYMVKNYTLPAGNYTLPANATLLVPMSGQTTSIGTSLARVTSAVTRSCNVQLTFATGVNITVYGTIETGSRQMSSSGATGYQTGSYGRIHMNANSRIDMESGSKIYCWGYITGTGVINAKDGSTINEQFELGDFKGGGVASAMLDNSYKVFLVTHYFYQSIEADVIYRPGSQALGYSTAAISNSAQNANGVKIVGETGSGSLFLMDAKDMREDTWLKKEYDPATERAVWTLNSGATLGSLSINISGANMQSANYILPISSQMDLKLNYGDMTLNQSTYFMPGSSFEIGREATLKIPSGKELYFIDQENWVKGYSVTNYLCTLNFSPTRSGNGPRHAMKSDNSTIPDAEFFIHGTVEVTGSFFTSGTGANLHSTNEDAGKVIFKSVAAANKTFYQCNSNCGKQGLLSYYWNRQEHACTSAKLKNGDGTYVATAGNSAGTKYIYKDDQWVKIVTDGCLEVQTVSGNDHKYAYTTSFIEVAENTSDNAYHDAAHTEGTSGCKYYVYTEKSVSSEGCVWWEVTKEEAGLYKAVLPDHNGKINYYTYDADKGYWVAKTVTITWNINGSTTNYTIGYGTKPQYLNEAPSKASTTTDYYTWLGWTKGSENGEFFAKDAELPVATENTTYYAYFKADKFTFRATFNNYDGSLLETKLVAAGETPVYEGETPVKPATTSKEYTFTGWNPALAAISNAPVTYTAQFSEKTREYTIQWVNYNGTVLKEEQVTYGSMPITPVTPTRPNDTYYTYTFDAWSPAISAVAGDQTYTATYNYEKKVPKYSATFMNGSKTVYTQALKSGEVPVFDGTTPTKTADAQYTYTFDGWSTTDGGALAYALGDALPALTADVTYYAHFATTTNTYKVYWRSEDGKVLYETDTNVPYGSKPSYDGETPTKPRQGATEYAFDGWSSSVGGAKIAIPSVTGHATYYAHFVEVVDEGPILDIVEWVSYSNGTDSLTINLNGIPAAGWPYTINGTEYNKEKRAADRTLTIPYSGSADDKLTITVKDKDNIIYSLHTYTIPHVYGSTANLEAMNSASSIIVVNNGTLTVKGYVAVNAIYVGPEAELVVNSGVKLTVNSLMLRTTPWKAASLDNKGTIEVNDQAYYTRIIADNSKYFQFAIPLASDVKNVRLSNNSKCTYNTSWMLKSYDEESRAINGAVNSETLSNWDLLTPDGEGHAPILGSVGYEMFSNTPYYREYYFPVEIPGETADKVAVSCTKPEGKTTEWYTAHSGWNALCSPFTGKYVQTPSDPSELLKVSELTEGGYYWQHAPEIIYPAVPFYYQVPENVNFLDFSGNYLKPRTVSREWNSYIPTQWLRLTINNQNGTMLDETSIYAHPEKFAPEYEIGYDVAKQSLTGGKALIYSELPCGKLAFAAVPDSLAENRIPITVNANDEGEFLFSLKENNYLGRLQHVLLHDMQNGFVTDLLERDYSAKLNAGTNAGRFYIQCVFAAEAPAVTTGVNSVESNDDAPQKIMYKNKVYIIYQGRVYDMTGRQCELK